jgi:hypothetical protein
MAGRVLDTVVLDTVGRCSHIARRLLAIVAATRIREAQTRS